MITLKSTVNSKWPILYLIFLILGSIQSCIAESDAPFELPIQTELNKLRSAIIYTNLGNIELELYPEDAPWHVANLKFRADKGFYKNTIFNHFEPNYLIQGGERSKTSAKPTYFLPPEFTGHRHEPGSVGMARPPDSSNPERVSHNRQFYIVLGHAPHMNGNYTIFGRVKNGMEIVEELREGDEIIDLKVFVRPQQRNF